MTQPKKKQFSWNTKRVLVTGGASFIGSTLVDTLLKKGASVRVVDDLSTGKKDNLVDHLKKKSIEFKVADLREPGITREAVKNIDVIFHLAGDHGGRGYVDLHQAGPASNLFLDGQVFWEAKRARVDKIVFASSGCVYPNYLQTNPNKKLYLTENSVKPPYDADNMYGWAKLMAELTLRAYHQEYGMKTASCRFFTVYGPRGVENHAVIALIAKAFIKQNPFEVWGDGTQVRNWTYVDDIVRGAILVAEKIHDGSAVNLGTTERIRVIDAVGMICKHFNHKPKIVFKKNMPVGPLNRVADNRLAKKLLGWEPEVKFKDGIKKTIEWYIKHRQVDKVRSQLKQMLTER